MTQRNNHRQTQIDAGRRVRNVPLPVALTSAVLLVLVLLITVRNGAGMGFV
ncbi:hypothetical protein [Luteimonas sp. 3794]|uniref:hypothetical protein n=1 Tax=Luteimonas sp. 3794 TaxID=2817730 RepID=UPI002863997C|nr:hypothetical protein [Luteimonas sp. 3794]MDR6992190.1 hypothetical protein [Luteimonas sp. 3794]